MSPKEFVEWRKGCGWTQKEAAIALHISRRSLQDYEGGKYAIPSVVALAMSAVWHRLGPWRKGGGGK